MEHKGLLRGLGFISDYVPLCEAFAAGTFCPHPCTFVHALSHARFAAAYGL